MTLKDQSSQDAAGANKTELSDDELVAADDSIIGRALGWSLVVLVLAGALGGLLFFANRPDEPLPVTKIKILPPMTFEVTIEAPEVQFTDITIEAGIDFVHENGAVGDKLLPETMGAGCAFFDYNNDGRPDLFLVNSTHWPDATPADAPTPVMALYRNDGMGRFTNVTAEAGLAVGFYGTGVAVGDFDNDGNVDLFVTAVGPNRLFRNIGGRFEEVTEKAGVAGEPDGWGSSAAFFDYDNDGRLDLFVCNYIRWSREIDFAVDYRLTGVGRAYGPPMNFAGAHPYLYHNNGDGTFTDVSKQAGMHIENPASHTPVAKSLGVAPTDIDLDGRMDLLVANDTVPNFLFHNRGDGTFAEIALTAGVAYDDMGFASGAMGIDAGYYRNDDTLGFFIGNFANEMTSVYASQGNPLLFSDAAIAEGIGAPSRLMLSFGIFLFDYDLDGRLDLLQTNGHLEEQINVLQPSQHYAQPAQLFWNAGQAGRSTFVAVKPATTGDLATPVVGRASAFADIDNDGDLDVIMTQVARRPLLLRNDQSLGHNWVRFKLVGTRSNRDAIGARIELRAGDITQVRDVMPTRSYLAQVELPVTFGLGDETAVDSVEITWPDGTKTSLMDVSPNRTHTIVQAD